MDSSYINLDIDKQNEGVSIKDLILKVIEWWKFLWKRKLIIILAGFIGAGIGLYFALKSKPSYEGQLTFLVEDNNSNPLGAYMGMASQFGIDLGRGSGNGLFEGDNIIEFLKSRLIIEKALLSPLNIGGKTITLAEHYINFNNLRKGWTTRPLLREVKYPVHADRQKFSLQQDSILNIIQKQILKKNLKVEKPDKKVSFITVTCSSYDELFSKAFTETLVMEATDFYIDTKTRKTKGNVDRLQAQADSMELLLNKKTYATALSQDINQNPAKQIANVTTELAMRDKAVLQTMYGEIVKNLEISKIAMAQDAPVIQIVDKPILPLDKVKLGKIKGVLLGGIILGFLSVIILLITKIFKDIMS